MLRGILPINMSLSNVNYLLENLNNFVPIHYICYILGF